MSIAHDFKDFIGPCEFDNFSALVFRLIAKADHGNVERLRLGYPTHVALYEWWEAQPNSHLSLADIEAKISEIEGIA